MVEAGSLISALATVDTRLVAINRSHFFTIDAKPTTASAKVFGRQRH
jgi:hypothetical protein